RGLPVDGYEIIKANCKEVYRDAFFSMKLSEVLPLTGSPWLCHRSRKSCRVSGAVENVRYRLCQHGRRFRRRGISTT
ncbi:MAG TPA: hypothetical protein VK603_24630, partial [Candidatus Saccharimonadales bacterium]|nr:hypothetical protein [Candidatus Saccharimonadales bacterium]